MRLPKTLRYLLFPVRSIEEIEAEKFADHVWSEYLAGGQYDEGRIVESVNRALKMDSMKVSEYENAPRFAARTIDVLRRRFPEIHKRHPFTL